MTRQWNMTCYLLGTWLFSVYLCQHFMYGVANETVRDHVHALLVLLTYGAMYQAPAVVSYWLLRRFGTVAILVTVFMSIVGHIFIFADSHLFDLYGFHVNGFVWNLLVSPGGLQSLGADQINVMLVVKYVTVLAAVHIVSLIAAAHWSNVRIPAGKLAIVFLIATLLERGIYGVSYAELYPPVLARGDSLPLYQPMKMNTLLGYLGVEIKKSSKIKLDQDSGALDYPKHPIVLEKVAQPLNILVLVSESMRWDLLTPEIMPNMSAFAGQSWKFANHYSGGNGTRQGLFGLFYGIPGTYWDRFLRMNQGPVLFDVLNDYDYQYFVYTSAEFTYPELDRTVFQQLPPEKLISHHQGEPWKRDVTNTTALINDLQGRDRSRAFFGFQFYEATHARYSFPETSVVRKDYLRRLDYAGMTREELEPKIDGIKARYENAAHGVDVQLQRVIGYLQDSGDIDNTLVIVTGDHGEEFMERGRWGHNSAFTDWQIRVPMILSMPGSLPRRVQERTSHLDVAATLLPLLGVQNPLKDYSLGVNLAEPRAHRNIMVSSWSDIGLINDAGKLVIPFKSTTQHQNLTTDLNDEPVDAGALTKNMQAEVFQALSDSRYYTSHAVPG